MLAWFDTRDMCADGLTKGAVERTAIHSIMDGNMKLSHEPKVWTSKKGGRNIPETLPNESSDEIYLFATHTHSVALWLKFPSPLCLHRHLGRCLCSGRPQLMGSGDPHLANGDQCSRRRPSTTLALKPRACPPEWWCHHHRRRQQPQRRAEKPKTTRHRRTEGILLKSPTKRPNKRLRAHCGRRPTGGETHTPAENISPSGRSKDKRPTADLASSKKTCSSTLIAPTFIVIHMKKSSECRSWT